MLAPLCQEAEMEQERIVGHSLICQDGHCGPESRGVQEFATYLSYK